MTQSAVRSAIVNPFTTNPNPALLYLTPSLRATIAKIRFVIDYRQGLTAILGDVGMGKSSLVRLLHLEYSFRDGCVSALIPTPNYPSDFGLLKGICKEFGVAPKRSMVDQEDELRAFLLKCIHEGRNCVVWIDEAQRLTTRMLELVRTLLNLETNTEKLIQVVLSGQLELRERLRQPAQRPIRSRILTPNLLDPLSPDEMAEVIQFRLQQAGDDCRFSPDALTRLYAVTHGVPRAVLQICSIAWGAARAAGAQQIDANLVEIGIEAQEAL
jgi:general secretion pathway protein A